MGPPGLKCQLVDVRMEDRKVVEHPTGLFLRLWCRVTKRFLKTYADQPGEDEALPITAVRQWAAWLDELDLVDLPQNSLRLWCEVPKPCAELRWADALPASAAQECIGWLQELQQAHCAFVMGKELKSIIVWSWLQWW